jgi:divinyl chlorophyllide a 8-vinyl-reductase
VSAPTRIARRVLLLGATGTIGRATARALAARGHEVIGVVRPRAGRDTAQDLAALRGALGGVDLRLARSGDPSRLVPEALGGARIDALVSCLASRSGAPRDAWAIDRDAQIAALAAARAAGAAQVVLLSAICVQKPRLAFQQAKLAAERAVIASGLDHAIVRPTAFFKSLDGQVERVRRGKPYLLFGDGRLTACKPISDADLGGYLAECLDAPARRNRILPIGGPGPAWTPRDMGARIFALLGRPPRFVHVPVRLLDAVIGMLRVGSWLVPGLADKAELARIGRYYATESMLLLDPVTGRYDAEATPSTGTERLETHYARLLAGEIRAERGDHAVF